MKDGILLTGGLGVRLKPFTEYTSKHLLNVGGKPVIDYPINTLKQLGVENLTIVVGSSFSGQILDYVKDGSKFGMNVNYIYQPNANGISFAINLCKRFIKDKFIVCLGDNLFFGDLKFDNKCSAQIALYRHQNLQRFGVASIKDNKIVKIEEKPLTLDQNLDNYAITGCYMFDEKYFEYFKKTKLSARAEFEVVHIIEQYLADGDLGYVNYDGVWLDAGTPESIAVSNNYIYTLDKIRNGNT